MHRLPTDELWHFYLRDPIELLLLCSDGSGELVRAAPFGCPE
jgi:predicted cupin superfamily sugar epimerase